MKPDDPMKATEVITAIDSLIELCATHALPVFVVCYGFQNTEKPILCSQWPGGNLQNPTDMAWRECDDEIASELFNVFLMTCKRTKDLYYKDRG